MKKKLQITIFCLFICMIRLSSLHAAQESESFYIEFLRDLASELGWAKDIFISELPGGKIFGISDIPFQQLPAEIKKTVIYIMPFSDEDKAQQQLQKNLNVYKKFCFLSEPFSFYGSLFYRTGTQLYTADGIGKVQLNLSYDIIEGAVGDDLIVCRKEALEKQTSVVPLFELVMKNLYGRKYEGLKKHRKKDLVPDLLHQTSKPLILELADLLPDASALPSAEASWRINTIAPDKLPFSANATTRLRIKGKPDTVFEGYDIVVEIDAYPSCGEPKVKIIEDTPRELQKDEIAVAGTDACVFKDTQRNRSMLLYAQENIFIKITGSTVSGETLNELASIEEALVKNISEKIANIFSGE